MTILSLYMSTDDIDWTICDINATSDASIWLLDIGETVPDIGETVLNINEVVLNINEVVLNINETSLNIFLTIKLLF